VELYLGELDDLINKKITLDYLKRNNIDFNYHIFPEMDHGLPLKYFAEILDMSHFTD
jgi:hypothetical protein